MPDDWVPSSSDHEYALSKNLNETEIKEMSDEFQAYWSDRGDAASRKSERGWGQCWQGHVRRNAWQFIKNRRPATGQARGDAAFDEARERAFRIGHAEKAPEPDLF